MAAPNIPLSKIKEVRSKLNATSKTFCLAKWLQVTIHLQNGQTHSCHHPKTHKIPLHELKFDVSALHNTSHKKLLRKQMLEDLPPSECEYCWNIENAHPENLSDRHMKSAQPWSLPRMNEVTTQSWNNSINPSYLELSFGNECNFRCAYCAPHISSSLMAEVKKFGPYPSQDGYAPEALKKEGLYPYTKDETNPYIDAFWDWWPSLREDLKVFRITGGEPLLNPNTFRFLDHIKENPIPDLVLAINSNLGVPQAVFDNFIKEIKFITENKLVKEFQLFTSVDGFGSNAEFIRFGLNYESFMNNVKTYLQEIADSELIFMSTYNAFSVLNYRKFLEEVINLKSTYFDRGGNTRVTLDIPYLKEPGFLSCYVLTDQFLPIIKSDIQFLRENAISPDGKEIIYQTEISKLERIALWLESLEENEHRNNTRREMAHFLKEYCRRKEISFEDYVPEYLEFIEYCNQL